MVAIRPDETNPGARSRVAAARVLKAVRDDGRSLVAALERTADLVDERDAALVQGLCYGVLRTLPRWEAAAGRLLRKPFDTKNRDLDALLLVGLYQLAATRVPPHAAVAATVDAARLMRKPWAVSLMNAVLRRFAREGDRLLAADAENANVRWLFPDWLLERLRAAWPADWMEVVAASNEPPPMVVRVNTARIAPADWAERLAEAHAEPVPHTESGMILDTPLPVARLPGFETGLVSVQDGGAQLAAPLLDARPGERVLDACAAPGGKTMHMLERAGGALRLAALDIDEARLARVAADLERLGLEARLVRGDAATPEGDWAGERYERVLLDAPCSATGVIRRHPDIKWLRRAADVAELVRIQARMLDALWPLVAPGGSLLYCTCSILPEENDGQIGPFLAAHPDAIHLPIAAPWGIARPFGRQILPHSGGAMDGFYYAKLGKRPC